MTRPLEFIGMAEEKYPSKKVLTFFVKLSPKIKANKFRGEIWNTSPALGENLDKSMFSELARVYELKKNNHHSRVKNEFLYEFFDKSCQIC